MARLDTLADRRQRLRLDTQHARGVREPPARQLPLGQDAQRIDRAGRAPQRSVQHGVRHVPPARTGVVEDVLEDRPTAVARVGRCEAQLGLRRPLPFGERPAHVRRPGRAGRRRLRRGAQRVVELAQVEQEEQVPVDCPVGGRDRVTRRDTLHHLAVQQDLHARLEALEHARLHGDVLAAGDAAQPRARDAPALRVEVARVVAEDAADHAHEGLRPGHELRGAVALAHDALGGRLPVGVDGDQELAALGLGDGQRVVEAALPVDLGRLGPEREDREAHQAQKHRHRLHDVR
jgi:hypothetical protein